LIRNSLDALAHCIIEEYHKGGADVKHTCIDISCTSKRLSNGLQSCSVQINCAGGCGWLIESFGDEANGLAEIATRLKSVISDPKCTLSLPEIVNAVMFETTANPIAVPRSKPPNLSSESSSNLNIYREHNMPS
jgi:hypothetical protein